MPPAPKGQQSELASVFKFIPDWIFDPVPPWLFTRLDDATINALARVHFDALRKGLQMQLEVLDQVEGIVGKRIK